MFKYLLGLFKPESVVVITSPEPQPKPYSYRIREVVYGSGIKDYYLEQYTYRPRELCNRYSIYYDNGLRWREQKKYHSLSLAQKAKTEREQEDYNKSIISDKVIT